MSVISKPERIITIVIIINAAIFLLIAGSISWVVISNCSITCTEYTVEENQLPKEFDGFKIAQVSDLHNAEFGAYNRKLIKKLYDAKPDIIVITGDMIDSRNTDYDVALEFARSALNVAPCYYVSGNHESRVSEYVNFKVNLIKAGVIVLEDQRIDIERGGEKISLIGMADPSFVSADWSDHAETIVQNKLSKINYDKDGYNVLLAHHPEYFEIYADNSIDLVFSGHAHGGQFRLPFIGGVYAPGQGFFPKYDEGVFEDGDTVMVVSRGLGNSVFPFRINNDPQLVVVELKSA